MAVFITNQGYLKRISLDTFERQNRATRGKSGIKTKEDVTRLKENNVDAVLIGETLMKSDDKKAMILELKNG